ncbi:hypothetical protein BT63DRAFT_452356 [Microthyrium microscopicum]|uniref:Killer toxin Kp4 domain-containing protein n=1 Tax=Microthyrium microscopicum TaxID=703497 RepID=A0A6A6UI35_9PEZI|nr:hypothetical protein BT63DRAFT_452356 [Microthyrium microscopicum]
MAIISRLFLLSILTNHILPISSLGINCRGSGVCPLATLFAGSQNAGQDIIQGLLNMLQHTTLPDSTTYSNGEHIACVSNTIPITLSIGPPFIQVQLGGGIPAGGICMFAQNLSGGKALSLGDIKTLAEDIVQHGCKTCGSVPITFPDNENVDDVGELTVNFVSEGKFVCDGNCVSAVSNSNIGAAASVSSGSVVASTSNAVTQAATVTVAATTITRGTSTSTTSGPPTVTVTQSEARRSNPRTFSSLVVLLGLLSLVHAT